MSKMTKQLTTAAVAMTAAGLCATPADALMVTITSGANAGTVVFDSGGYEASIAGALPGVSDPTVGTYEFNDTDGVTAATGPAQDGLTAANQGANYLSVDRGATDASSNSYVNHLFSQGIDATTESFSVELAVWGSEDYLAMALGGSGTDSPASSSPDLHTGWGYHTTQGLREYGNSSTGLSGWNIGSWNIFTYNWDAGAGVGTLNVNGTDNTMAAALDPLGTVSQFHVRANAGGNQVYIDSVVPEPATLGLLAGGLAMLASRRTKAS